MAFKLIYKVHRYLNNLHGIKVGDLIEFDDVVQGYITGKKLSCDIETGTTIFIHEIEYYSFKQKEFYKIWINDVDGIKKITYDIKIYRVAKSRHIVYKNADEFATACGEAIMENLDSESSYRNGIIKEPTDEVIETYGEDYFGWLFTTKGHAYFDRFVKRCNKLVQRKFNEDVDVSDYCSIIEG